MNRWKILLTLVILEGIWLLSMYLPSRINVKQEVSNIIYNDLDSSTKYDLLQKRYIIAEVYDKNIDIDYNSLIQRFNKKVVFIILDYNRNQANVYSAINRKEVRNVSYESILDALCSVAVDIPPDCIK